MIRTLNRIALCAALVVAASGCRHARTRSVTPQASAREHCWWKPLHTTLPPDSVAARFVRAFTKVGFSNSSSSGGRDSASAHAGPTPLPGAFPGAVFESWAWATRDGDTSLVHYELAMTPPPGGWPQPVDSSALFRRRMGVCGDIIHAVFP